MVHRKQSSGALAESPDDSNSTKEEMMPVHDDSGLTNCSDHFTRIANAETTVESDWIKAQVQDVQSAVVYGHHIQMETYPAGNWCDGWAHAGVPPMMGSVQGDCPPMDKSLVEATNMALAQATAIPEGRVVGVYFDKQRRIWRATWREHGQGKRKTKNFSVDDYGFEEARRMAIQFRLVKLMEASDQAMHDQELMQHGVASLSNEYKRTLTPSPGSNRRKRRRYGSPESFAPKLPMWAQSFPAEAVLPPEDVFSTSAIWPPLYGHPSAFIHMEHLRNTQHSWATKNAPASLPSESRESTAATTTDGVLDRADLVSTVDSTLHDHAMKYEVPRTNGGLIC